MNDSSSTKRLCTKCIGAASFIEIIREHGSIAACGFDPAHGARRKTMALGDFAGYVDEHFRKTYQLGREEPYFHDDSDRLSYRQRGSTLLEILSDDLAVEGRAVAEAIIHHLPDVDWHDVVEGADAFYDDGANYERASNVEMEERADQEDYWFENRFRYEWSDFCGVVRYQNRHFAAKALLDHLFGAPSKYEDGPVAPIYELAADLRVFRARRLDDRLTAVTLAGAPAAQLGAPPRDRAKSGRMNVELIPAFYAAFGEDTAVAELRPGIEEEIAIGEFVLRRAVRVFDFTVFSRVLRDRPSNLAHTRYEFVTQLEGEISRPVRAHERQRDYIPTQIVAEYLREFFRCEAVIYRSSVMKERMDNHRNVVFLPRSDPFSGSESSILLFDRYVLKEVTDIRYEVSAPAF